MKFELNSYLLTITRMEIARIYPTLESVLQALGEAIQSTCNELDAMKSKGLEPEHEELVVDEVACYIESLLGAAFVVCQSHLSEVVSYAKDLHGFVHKKTKLPLVCCDGSKKGILAMRSRPIGGSTVSEMELIDAAANYFKHNSEWGNDWTKLKRTQQQQTANTLMDAGVSRSSGVLRDVAAKLGNKDLHDTRVFAIKVLKWHRAVERTYRAELKGRALA